MRVGVWGVRGCVRCPSVWCAHAWVVAGATCECRGLHSRCELTFSFLKFLPFIKHMYLFVCL